ncbi:MAG: glycosyltransferase family 87 protein [Myxococcales bacterium]|nr:glycosyltransferase family 87 protein [Myxococcales bacterium]
MSAAPERWMVALAARRDVRLGAVAAALGLLVGLGVLGLGHAPGTADIDTRYFFIAGRYWGAGMSAYVPVGVPPQLPPLGDAIELFDFAYAPTSAALCMLVALGSFPLACRIMATLNLLAIAVIARIGVGVVEEPGPYAVAPSVSTAQRWFVPALVAGNLSTIFVVWTGQSTLIVTAALAAAWHWARRGRTVPAGVTLALASMKPTLSVFVVLWFLLARRWRVLLVTAASALVLAWPAIRAEGPLQVLLDWRIAIGRYGTHWYNALGTRMLFNLRSLLNAAGIETPDLLIVGLLVTLVLWWYRRRITERDVLPLLIGIAMLFGFAHGYDVAALAVLIPSFWRHLHDRPRAGLVALALLFAITFPNSLLEGFGSDLLLHARVALTAGALAWLVVLSAAETAADPAAAGVATAAGEVPRLGAPGRWMTPCP